MEYNTQLDEQKEINFSLQSRNEKMEKSIHELKSQLKTQENS
jgi:hypothetical protein